MGTCSLTVWGLGLPHKYHTGVRQLPHEQHKGQQQGGKALWKRPMALKAGNPAHACQKSMEENHQRLPGRKGQAPSSAAILEPFHLVLHKKGNLKSKRNNKLISLQIICKGSKCIVNVCLYPTGNLMNFIDCFCIAVCCATSSTEIVAGLMLSLAHSVIAPCNLLPGKVTEKERRGVKNNIGGWGAKKKEREKSDSI